MFGLLHSTPAPGTTAPTLPGRTTEARGPSGDGWVTTRTGLRRPLSRYGFGVHQDVGFGDRGPYDDGTGTGSGVLGPTR